MTAVVAGVSALREMATIVAFVMARVMALMWREPMCPPVRMV
ncbi:hypothetical protein [Streptomyces sp. NPDC047000]